MGTPPIPGPSGRPWGQAVEHRCNQYLNNRLEQDHRGIKQRYYPMRGFGSFAGAARFCSAHDELRDHFRARQRQGETVPLAEQRRIFIERLAEVACLAGGLTTEPSRACTCPRRPSWPRRTPSPDASLQDTGTAWADSGLGAGGGAAGAVTKISEVIVGSGGAASIPSPASPAPTGTWSWWWRRGGSAAYGAVRVHFNGDTGSNYDDQLLSGNGSTAAASEDHALAFASIGFALPAAAAAGDVSVSRCRIYDYARTAWRKAWMGEYVLLYGDASGQTYAGIAAGKWRSTSAITSILVFLENGNFVQDCYAELWGIV